MPGAVLLYKKLEPQHTPRPLQNKLFFLVRPLYAKMRVSGGVPNLADPVHAFQVDRQGQPGLFGIKGDQLDQIAEGYDLNFRRIWRTSTSMRANSMR